MTELVPTGKLKPSTTAPPPHPSFPTLPPKPSNIPLKPALTSKKPPGPASEVAADQLGNNLDKTAQKGRNMSTSHKSSNTSQVPDVEMNIIEEEVDNDDDYITEEEYVKGHQYFRLPQGGQTHNMIFQSPFPPPPGSQNSFVQSGFKVTLTLKVLSASYIHMNGWQPYIPTSLASTSLSQLHAVGYKCRFLSLSLSGQPCGSTHCQEHWTGLDFRSQSWYNHMTGTFWGWTELVM